MKTMSDAKTEDRLDQFRRAVFKVLGQFADVPEINLYHELKNMVDTRLPELDLPEGKPRKGGSVDFYGVGYPDNAW